MPRSGGGSYVDNAHNRSLGRVGMAYGTAVVSRGSSGGYSSSGGWGGFSSSSNGGGGSSSRTYVDNAYNRRVGRVGMEHGTAVVSRGSSGAYSSSGGGGSGFSSSSYGGGGSSSRTYVDNAYNRNLGRVGLEHGTAVVSRGSNSYSSSSSSRTYVDNTPNRSLGRVGLPLGSAVQSKGNKSSAGCSYGASSKTYIDNAYNRRLGRVGLPYGSQTGNSNTSAKASGKTYVDNALNRRLGRVGKPLGSCPMPKSSRPPIREIYAPLTNVCEVDYRETMEKLQKQIELCEERDKYFIEKAFEVLNRHEATSADSRRPNRPRDALDWVKGGEIIDFKHDLELGNKIGAGGFGDIFVGFWKDYQVAVKKLRVQRVSQARKKQFEEEVRVYSQLNHPGIVKFYGVCVTPPDLAIVMEFMAGGSLYDLLHVEARAISPDVKRGMVEDCLSALCYMHEKDITHRDIKSMNVLVTEDLLHCKLGDFGLALKEESQSSCSIADHSAVGTLKYSPPEVVNGDRLNLSGLKLVDVYSMGLVILELFTEEEPYRSMNQHQVRRAILDHEVPSMDKIEDEEIRQLLRRALSPKPEFRPGAAQLHQLWELCIDHIEC